MCRGLGGAASNVHKEIYKAARTCLTDRVMAVRVAAADCLMEMMEFAPFLYTTELENMASLCFRALDGSNYSARQSVARLLGVLVASTQESDKNKKQGVFGSQAPAATKNSSKSTSLEESLGLLAQGFLKGGVGSFLKGTVVSPELRVGVSHSYVVMIQTLGPAYLETNIRVILSHVLELANNTKSGSSHTESVCCRNCVVFILSTVLGRMLREKAQLAACKELVTILAKSSAAADKEESPSNTELQVAALLQLGSLAARLGTVTDSLLPPKDSSLKLLDTVFSCLLSPSLPVRLAASQTLRQVTTAVPGKLTPLLDKCCESLENYKSTPEAVSGYSCGLAGLLGAVTDTPNGIPHTRGKIIFNCGEELLRSASQNSRLSKERTRAGWLLIGSIMSLGSSVVSGLLARCMLLWRNAFPRSAKELESEKARGDAFTWQVSLEARAGALASIYSFLTSCPDLVTEVIVRRLAVPLESALSLLTVLASGNSPIKSYAGQLKAPTAIVRLRLLEVVSVLPPNTLEPQHSLPSLLRLLVSEFCLTDPSTTPTSTSLLPSLLQQEDLLLIHGGGVPDNLQQVVEAQLQAHSAAGSQALEHDLTSLYRDQPSPSLGPPPLGVSVIDLSIVVFGRTFPQAANKHRLQMLNHFTECLKTAKASRLEELQLNIMTALLSGLKGLVEEKVVVGGSEVVKVSVSLIRTVLTSSNPGLRCAAGECLGRIAQVRRTTQLTSFQLQ